MAKLPQDYDSVMARKQEVMKAAIGIDYSRFESGSMAFDYERMMRETGYSLEEMQKIQRSVNVGDTPILELKNLTALARACAPEGKGARIFIKDEAANPSGSFKARRAANAVYHAKKLGYKGVIAATSGNYGAAVASQAAIAGLECIIVQECYDSKGVGQPEIIEKARKCEALGAEVVQLTVGPELFYKFLLLLEETGYFNASLYTPFGIAGVETLGYEISMQFREKYGKDPDAVVCTNAGGGNLTGTARGLIKAGAVDTTVIGASIDLSGLHMASDKAFNLKSCTTGHTGGRPGSFRCAQIRGKTAPLHGSVRDHYPGGCLLYHRMSGNPGRAGKGTGRKHIPGGGFLYRPGNAPGRDDRRAGNGIYRSRKTCAASAFLCQRKRH